MKRKAKPPRPVKLKYRGQYILLDPSEQELLDRLMTTTQLEPRLNDNGELVFDRRPQSGYLTGQDEDRNDCLLVPIGRRSELFAQLQAERRVQEKNWPRYCASRPVSDVECVVERAEGRLLDTLKERHQGQVVLHNESQMYRALEALLTYYSGVRVLVLTATQADAEALRAFIDKRIKNAGRYENIYGKRCRRVVVAKLATFERDAEDLNGGWQLVIYWGSQAGLTKKAEEVSELLSSVQHGNTLRQVLLRTSQALSNPDCQSLQCLVGDVIFERSSVDHDNRPLEVISVPAPQAQRPNPRAAQVGLPWKRKAVWHNNPRNQLVQQLGLAALAADWAKLDRLSATELRARATDPMHGLPAQPRVTILVESAEHGRRLTQLLPGWKLKTNEPPPRKAPVTPAKLDWNPCRGVIKTLAHADEFGCSADLVIRADGTGTDWHPDWSQDRATEHSAAKPLWVIDIMTGAD